MTQASSKPTGERRDGKGEQRGESGGPRRSRRPRRPERGAGPTWEKPDFLADAVSRGIDRDFIRLAEKFAREFGRGLPMEGVRRVQGEILRLELAGIDSAGDRLLLLKPHIAHSLSRDRTPELNIFRRVIERGFDRILEKEGEERAQRFERFRNGLDAILCYQAAHAPRGRN